MNDESKTEGAVRPAVVSVTVLLAVYNGETYLRESLDSVLRQSFGDFEFSSSTMVPPTARC